MNRVETRHCGHTRALDKERASVNRPDWAV